MKPEFEEKVYESWFNTTLAKKYPIYFAPGQVCENLLGFDAAFQITDSEFKEFVIRKSWFLRTLLKSLPNIEVNCFFQYKRPDEISAKNGKEWKYWNKSYFRYEIYQEQQQILEDLYKSLNCKPLILYAAPETIKIEELYDFYKEDKIIERSNFTEAKNLTGHHVNTYVKGGKLNQAFSKPETIESLSFEEYIESVIENNKNQEASFISNAIEVAKAATKVMSNNEKYKNIFPSMVEDSYGRIADLFYRSDQFMKKESLLQSLNIMLQFKLLTGIQWGCYFQNTEGLRKQK